MSWHCVETYAQHEKTAKWRLKAALGYSVFLPMCRSWAHHPETVMFPRYLFVEIGEGQDLVQRDTSYGIVGLVRFGGDSPCVVPDGIIAELKARSSRDGGSIVLNRRPSLRRGQKAAVIEGRWAGHEGLYLGSAEQRATLLLDILAKHVRVTVPIETVVAAQ
jgi:transcription antitermination factor NusG